MSDKRFEIAKKLVIDAKNKNSEDNLTAVVSNATQYAFQVNVIIDGHGGSEVAQFVKQMLPILFELEFTTQKFVVENDKLCSYQDRGQRPYQEDRCLVMYSDDITTTFSEDELKQKLQKINVLLHAALKYSKYRNDAQEQGACINIGLIQYDYVKDEVLFVTGHLGDSSHYIIDNTQAINVTGHENWHKAPIKNGNLQRLGNSLAITRALGDFAYDKHELRHDMQITSHTINNAKEKNPIIVGVCDGIGADVSNALLHPNSIKNTNLTNILDVSVSEENSIEEKLRNYSSNQNPAKFYSLNNNAVQFITYRGEQGTVSRARVLDDDDCTKLTENFPVQNKDNTEVIKYLNEQELLRLTQTSVEIPSIDELRLYFDNFTKMNDAWNQFALACNKVNFPEHKKKLLSEIIKQNSMKMDEIITNADITKRNLDLEVFKSNLINDLNKSKLQEIKENPLLKIFFKLLYIVLGLGIWLESLYESKKTNHNSLHVAKNKFFATIAPDNLTTNNKTVSLDT